MFETKQVNELFNQVKLMCNDIEKLVDNNTNDNKTATSIATTTNNNNKIANTKVSI